MKDEDKTKEQLIKELAEMRQRITELGASEAERKRAEEEIRLLLMTTQAISESQDFYAALGLAIHKVCETTGWNFGEAWVPSHDGKVLECSPAWYSSTNSLEKFRQLSEEFTFPPNTGLPGRVWSSKQPEWIPDVSSESEAVFLRAQIALESGLKAGFGVPIIANGQVLAVLAFFMFEPREEDNRLVEMVSAVATQLGSVTQRKRAEEQTRQLQEYLQLQIERMPIALIVWDAEFRVQSWNPSAEKMFGFTEQETLGKHPYDLIVPKEAQPHVNNIWRRLLEGDATAHSVNQNTTKDGRTILCDWTNTPLKKADGTVIGILSMVQDITERFMAEEALRDSEEKLRLMFESVTDGITTSDMDGNITQINEAVVRMHGFDSKEELIGRSALELIAEKDHARAMENMERTLKDGFIKNIEYTFLTKEGKGFPAELSAAVLRDASGKPTGFIAITKDITERKQMEAQLIVTDRLASIGELSSGIAHELNNPLTGVIGFSELLLDKDVPDNVKEDLKVINREAKRAAEVVRNLLAFARKHAPEKKPVDINGAIKTVLALRVYEQRVNNIKVNAQLASDIPEITADGFQLQQVFLNIIVNAEHFMIEAHGRGTLTITTERVGDIIRASFADDGPGIAKENLGYLFDPFFTTKEVGKGTGLGLSICHGIITEHGGRIYAESELGKGATFIIELPINK